MGICTPAIRMAPVALRERCGFAETAEGVTLTPCREGLCRTHTSDVPETCMPVVAIGEDCADAWCGADAQCVEGRCTARPVLGDPCLLDDLCNRAAYGAQCADGICVASDRGIGDTCAIHDRRPCAQGVCAEDETDPEQFTCQPSLRSPIGGLCRRNDDDCLDGACCAGMCVSFGGLS